MLDKKTQRALEEKIAKLRSRASAAVSQHYSNQTMDALAKQIASCDALFHTNPKTGEIPHRSKDDKTTPKDKLLKLVEALDDACPRRLMVSAEPGSVDLEPGNLIAYVNKLSEARGELARFDEQKGSYRTRKEYKEARARVVETLKEDGKEVVEKLSAEIHALREGIQRKRPRTITMMDDDADPYRNFAELFVHVGEQDESFLHHFPKLGELVQTTRCHLALLDYVEKVQVIAEEMKYHQPALWEDNRDIYRQRLHEASDAFKALVPSNQHVTASAYQAFERANRRILRALDAQDKNAITALAASEEVTKATEHLQHLGLTFLVGGPPERERFDMKPPKEKPAQPKIFSRIAHAYIKDRDTYREQLAREAERVGKDYNDRERHNSFRVESEAMDYVYAARWVKAADKIEEMVNHHIGMLADATIDTLALGEHTSNWVGEVALKEKPKKKKPKEAKKSEGTRELRWVYVAEDHDSPDMGEGHSR